MKTNVVMIFTENLDKTGTVINVSNSSSHNCLKLIYTIRIARVE